MHCHTAWGQWAVGSGPPSMHCLTARGQWAFDLLQHTAPLPGGSGQWTSFNALPTAWGQWAVVLLQCTAPLPGGSGQLTSCNALPHCLGAAGSGPPLMHCPTA